MCGVYKYIAHRYSCTSISNDYWRAVWNNGMVDDCASSNNPGEFIFITRNKEYWWHNRRGCIYPGAVAAGHLGSLCWQTRARWRRWGWTHTWGEATGATGKLQWNHSNYPKCLWHIFFNGFGLFWIGRAMMCPFSMAISFVPPRMSGTEPSSCPISVEWPGFRFRCSCIV